jgi:gliding motility-associated-like protein
VDLSASPNATWVSPYIVRDGNCCGTTNPDNCLEFIITLHPNAIAVSFDITGGAVPPGALFYQVDCGSITPVGSPICLTGAGPHHLTFCKPGNNSNEFSITSYSEPIIGPDITLNSACQGFIYAQYYNEPSMSWSSIAPGAPGTYDGLLSCTAGCDTTYITAPNNPPAFIDYVVCGTDIGGCNPIPFCDTIRVNFIAPVTVDIDPDSTHLCFGEPGQVLTASPSGGTAPYNYLWNTGATTQAIIGNNGNYSVQVTDASGCLIAFDTVVVIQDALPILANAGADQSLCKQSPGSIALNGTVQTATGGIWSGGAGVFTPSNTDLNAIYTPTPAEVTSGSVSLVLTTTGNNGCNAHADTMIINFESFSNTINLNTNDVLCFGDSNGSATANVFGPYTPCTYAWDLAAPVAQNWINNLTPGMHQVTITNSMGCDTTINFLINEPTAVNTNIDSLTNNLCYGDSLGSAFAGVAGGIGPYSFSWNTNPAQNGAVANGLPVGTYVVTVTDFNGCQDSTQVIISQPLPLSVSLAGVDPDCFGNSTGAVQSTGNGGVGPYSYQWWNGPTSSNQYNLPSGTYTVTVTDSNGCQIDGNITLFDPSQLTGQITNDTIICPGANLAINTQISGGTGSYSYMWTPGGQTSSGIIVNPTVNSSYSVLVTDDNGCTIQMGVNVDVFGMNQNEWTSSISTDITCAGDPVIIDAQYLGNDSSVVLSWLHCPSCPTDQPITEYPTQSTTYVISATNGCGQVIYDTLSINVNPLPNISISLSNDDICPGESVIFSNLGTNDPTWDYTWVFGDGNYSNLMSPIHTYPNGGVYPISLSITDNNGCTGTVTNGDTVNVNFQVLANFDASTFFGTMMEPEINFYNQSINGVTFIWNFGDGDTSSVVNPSHAYETAGNYEVTLNAMNPAGCDDSITMIVFMEAAFELYVPNAFTPDYDDFNESFFPKGFGISDNGYTFRIYNRWGDLVFETQELFGAWSGRMNNGDLAQDGTYTWTVAFRDELGGRHQRKGHVSLLK